MVAVLAVSRDDLERPAVALGLVALALVVTVVAGVLARSDPPLLLTPPAVAVELAVGAPSSSVVESLTGRGMPSTPARNPSARPGPSPASCLPGWPSAGQLEPPPAPAWG